MLAGTVVIAALAAAPPTLKIDAARPIGSSGKVEAHMRAPGFAGRIAIEVRGRWSRHFPKKSYRFEVRDPDGSNRNAALLGMPADDDWILYAAYNDRTLIRNVLAYDTARRMGRYAARTRFVELRLNGRYHGVYVLTEKLKLHAQRVRGGYLLERTSRRQAKRKDPSFLTPLTRRPVVWEDPERKDLGARAAAQIRAAVAQAEHALYRGPPSAWRRHLHAGSAVDFVLVQELFKNQDGMEASTYMSGRHGARLRLGPVWDFDISMGAAKHRPGRGVTGWTLAHRPWASRLYTDRAFARAMDRRWRQLRRGGLRGWLLRSVDTHAARLADAARRDGARWPAGGERPRGSRRTHIKQLRRWLVRRVGWLDRNLPRLG